MRRYFQFKALRFFYQHVGDVVVKDRPFINVKGKKGTPRNILLYFYVRYVITNVRLLNNLLFAKI